MQGRWKRFALPAWTAVMALLVLAPLLRPGYVLHLDMVFVPHQTLLPWNLGIGAGLPRSVPQDAVVSLLAGPVPGQLVQKAVLLATFVLAGIGAGRLSRGSMAVSLAAASLYVWTPYLAGRLLLGHWGLLWAYALLPWVIAAAREAATTRRWYPLAILCGAGALVPTGGIALALAGMPLAVGFGSLLRRSTKWLLVGLVVLLNAPWWLPSVRSAAAGISDPLGLEVFGARADGPGGVLLSVLAGGGVWNSQVALGSRSTIVATFVVVVVLALAMSGYPLLLRTRRPEAVWLGVLGLAGVLWAWMSGVAAGASLFQFLVSEVPGGGLLRDGQKWTLYWVLLIAVCAPLGLERIGRRTQGATPRILAVALILLPVAAMPDLAWGGFGRLHTATYPASWAALRSELATDPRPGDVVALPWTPYRTFPWNSGSVVLDPLPRYLTRTVVWNDALPVTLDGRLVSVGGDDPRAATIRAAVSSGRPLVDVLPALGIRWAVMEGDQPAAGPEANLTGMRRVWARPDLQLWEVPDAAVAVKVSDALVVAVDAAALLALLVLCGRWLLTRAQVRSDAAESDA